MNDSSNNNSKKKDKIGKTMAMKVVLASSGLLIPLLFIVVIFITVATVLGIIDVDTGSSSGNNTGITSECNFTINSTPLTKEEYISKIEEYASTHKSANIFAENASEIYDKAIEYNINPELVIIRAVSEGYSPALTGSPTSNNYWGLGCSNTGGINACINYSSFMNGVEAFLKNISQYDSLASMMNKYAYLGEYWYNPGSSSSGGCYYAKYIYNENNMPSRVKSACASGNNCSGSSCTKTTSSDQLAYSTWQVEKMAVNRTEIFGLEGNSSCSQINSNTYDGTFIWPCEATTITSKFGYRGDIGVVGASSNHHGVDIGASYGSEVWAMATGTVYKTGSTSTRGYYVVIDHGGNVYTEYQHLSKITCKEGDIVSQKQVIAYSGNSGVGSSHLHIEIWMGGESFDWSHNVDPLKYVSP